MRYIGVAVGVAPFILSGTIFNRLFARILTFENVMGKWTLKISMIPQKSEWLASLLTICLDKKLSSGTEIYHFIVLTANPLKYKTDNSIVIVSIYMG